MILVLKCSGSQPFWLTEPFLESISMAEPLAYPISYKLMVFSPLNAELNPICHMLALLGAPYIYDVSGLRVKSHIVATVKVSENVTRKELLFFHIIPQNINPLIPSLNQFLKTDCIKLCLTAVVATVLPHFQPFHDQKNAYHQGVLSVDQHVEVTQAKVWVLIIKPTRCTDFSNLFLE